MAPSPPPRLDPSELGTKEYWDATYSTDLTTHAATPSHTGHTWFGDTGASRKILAYLVSPALGLPKPSTSFLDLGTGNGEMLFLLREAGGFGGRMLGVDYSAAGVELAGKVAAGKKGLAGEVGFRVWDVLGEEGVGGDGKDGEEEGWDVVLDKGTFDAVGLMGEEGVEGRYVQRVKGLVRRGGRVLVTSCNWTEGEVRGWFEGRGQREREGEGEGAEGGELVFEGRVEYPRFRFGGVEGTSVVSVCFRRR